MFRPTTGFALAGLVIVGVIIADALIHPQGVTAAGNSFVSILKPTYSALLGTPPK